MITTTVNNAVTVQTVLSLNPATLAANITSGVTTAANAAANAGANAAAIAAFVIWGFFPIYLIGLAPVSAMQRLSDLSVRIGS